MRRLRTRDPACREFLLSLGRRGQSVDQQVEERVREILDDIRQHGTDGLLRWSRHLDGMPPESADPELPPDQWRGALERIGPEERAALEKAAERIRAFHERKRQESWLTVDGEGVLLGQLLRPLDQVGIYVPGGRAAYPSSVLMNAIPARVAGVRQVVMCCPLSWNSPNQAVLAAAELAAVDRIFRLGGAQAVAAMALGAGGVPRVDKIVGPGNAYVTAAKRMVFGLVDIDMIAGPSEILVVADGTVPAGWAAADLLSQAEHDERAAAAMLTPSEAYAGLVEREVERQLAATARRAIVEGSLQAHGAIILTEDLDEALEIASDLAPEHLELLVDRPLDYLHRVAHVGAVFLGPWSPEAVGDYLAGPSHVLPTGGTARFSSPLGVEDFVKRTSVIGLAEGGLKRLGPHLPRLATLEGLPAHARSVECRLEHLQGPRRSTD